MGAGMLVLAWQALSAPDGMLWLRHAKPRDARRWLRAGHPAEARGMSEHDPLAEVLGEEQLAEYLGITVRRLRDCRDLPYVKFPGAGRAYLAADVLTWLRKRRVAKGTYRDEPLT